MPKDITVRFENGSEVTYKNAPDDITPEQVYERAQSEYDLPVAELKAEKVGFDIAGKAASVGGEAAKVADTAVRGAYAIPMMAAQGLRSAAGHLGEMVPESIQSRLPNIPQGPFSALENLLAKKPEMEPQTGTGQLLGDIGASVAGAMTAPGAMAAPKLAAAIGVGSGVGAQAAGALTDQNPYAELVGGLIGGGATSLASALRDSKGKLARAAVEDIPVEALLAGRSNQQAARELGVNLTAGQAVPGRFNIRDIEAAISGTQGGKALTRQLMDQPQEIRAMNEAMLRSLPGTQRNPQDAANTLQQAATSAIQNLRGIRTSQAQPFYQAAGAIADDTADDLVGALVKRSQELEGTKQGKLLGTLAKNLTTKVDDEIVPRTDIDDINRILRSTSSKLTKPKHSFDREAVKVVKGEIKNIRDTLKDESPEFAKGEQAYKEVSRKIVSPAEKGPVGKLMEQGYDTPVANPNVFKQIMDKGTPTQGNSDIIRMNSVLSRQGEEGKKAFNDGVVTWVAQKLDKAMPVEGDALTDRIAEITHKALVGTGAQRQGMKDAISAMAKNMGKDQAEAVRGFETYAETLRRASVRPTNLRNLSQEEIGTIARPLADRAAGISALLPWRIPMRIGGRLVTKNNQAYMAELLTTEKGMDTLIELAKKKPGSDSALRVIGTFNASLAAEQVDQNEEK